MVTMSIIKKEPPKKKTGMLVKMFGTHQTKPALTPETKKAIVSGTKTAAKQMARGAGVMGRGLYKGLVRVGENIQASGMFSEAEQPKRSEYLPGARKGKGRKTTKRARKPKSRLQELQDAGLI